jgi:hypothetical protein
MPLLEVIQSRQVSASVRLDETTAALVDQYAAFIHASADDVVSKALHYVFAKDRDFQDYLKSSLARQVTPTLRVRKVSVTTDSKRKPVRNAVSGVELVESVRVMRP